MQRTSKTRHVDGLAVLVATVAVLLAATAAVAVAPFVWQGVVALVDVLTLAAAEFITGVLGVGAEKVGEVR